MKYDTSSNEFTRNTRNTLSEYGVVKIDNLPGDAFEMKSDARSMCDDLGVHPITIGINAKFGIAYVTLKIEDCETLQSATYRKKWKSAILRSCIQKLPDWYEIPADGTRKLKDSADESEKQMNIALVASLEDQTNPDDLKFEAEMNDAILAKFE